MLMGTACGYARPTGELFCGVNTFIRIMQTMQSDVDAGGAFVRGLGAWKGEANWLMVDR
jgi:hypothetical protein